MSTEERSLLVRDLCGRLPYGVQFKYKGEYGEEPEPQRLFELNRVMVNTHYELEGCKPYLRPMSSMTEAEKKKYEYFCQACMDEMGHNFIYDTAESFDYLDSIHVDYRGLLFAGLAIEAPADMYEIEK